MGLSLGLVTLLDATPADQRVTVMIRCAPPPEYLDRLRDAFTTGRGTATTIGMAIEISHEIAINPVIAYLNEHGIPHEKDARWLRTLRAMPTAAQARALIEHPGVTHVYADVPRPYRT